MSQPKDEYIHEESMNDLWNVWYSELHNGKSGLTLKINRVVESLESEFQRIDVVENDDFATCYESLDEAMIRLWRVHGRRRSRETP